MFSTFRPKPTFPIRINPRRHLLLRPDRPFMPQESSSPPTIQPPSPSLPSPPSNPTPSKYPFSSSNFPHFSQPNPTSSSPRYAKVEVTSITVTEDAIVTSTALRES
ncbi:hypothetical protein ACFX15_033595 [Malus domestica]